MFTSWEEITGEGKSPYSSTRPTGGRIARTPEASALLKKASTGETLDAKATAIARKKYLAQSNRGISQLEADSKLSDVGFGNPGEAGTDREVSEDFSEEETHDSFQIVRPAIEDQVEKRRAGIIAKNPKIDLSTEDKEVDHLVGDSPTLTEADLPKHEDEYNPTEIAMVHVEDYPDGLDCKPRLERIKNHALRTFLQRADPNFLRRVWENASKIEVRTHPVTGEIQLNIQSSKGHLVIEASDFSLLLSVPEVDDDSKIALSFPQAVRTQSGRFEIPSTFENQLAMRKFFGSLRIDGHSPGEKLDGSRKTSVDFKMWYKKQSTRVATRAERDIAQDIPDRRLWNDPLEPGW